MYDDRSQVVFKMREPAAQLEELLKYGGGQTDFELPLADAYTLAQDSLSEFDAV